MLNHSTFGVSDVSTLEWVGTSEKSEQIRNFLVHAAKSDATILLTGETGVGKDHVARMIHDLGRSHRSFVHVNCGGLNDSLLESELFGHTKGSFTGAYADKRGLVRQAEEGTLFFNEVANMSLELQSRLLVVMEKRNVRQVGGHQDFSVNTRIIAATNADLEERVKVGKMREDLYHRLNVIHFHVPSLRERIVDVRELASGFLRFQSKTGELKTFSEEAFRLLETYSWPGNIRELENLVKRLLFFCEDKSEFGYEDVKSALATSKTAYETLGAIKWPPIFPSYKEVKMGFFKEALRRTRGNVKAAARLIGMQRSNLNLVITRQNLEEYVIHLREARRNERRPSRR